MKSVASPVSSVLNEMARSLRKKFEIEEIILFGSQAYGEPDASSDFDLLIVMATNGYNQKKAAEIRRHLYEEFGAPFPVDIIVRSQKQIEERIQANDYFLKEILEKGTRI